MSAIASHYIWYELMSDDLDAAARFYDAVIGWSVRDSGMPGRDYRIVSMGDISIGGMMQIPPPAAAMGMKPAWFGYLNVANVAETVAAITADGGQVHMPETTIPNVGTIAMVTDPQGAAFYIMSPIGEGESQAFQQGRHGHGGWNELHTTDWQAAFAFYAKHFGWGKSLEMDMGPHGIYLLFNVGGDAIGGMMNSPNFPRPAWLYYISVSDIDATHARIEANGGKVLLPPMQVPGGGWIVQAQDPQGALFAITGPRLT